MMHQPLGNSYAQAAIDRECEDLARTGSNRNNRLNQAAFSLGQLVGALMVGRRIVEARLYAAAESNGYVQTDGPGATKATIKSGLEKGMRDPRRVPEGVSAPTFQKPPRPM